MKKLLLLHGYNSDGAEMHSEFVCSRIFQQKFMLFSVDAPHSCDLNPQKKQWFRLTKLKPFLDRWIPNAAEQLARKFFDHEFFAIIGHSQGAMIAEYIGERELLKVSKVICISGAKPSPCSALVNKNLDISYIYGSNDEFSDDGLIEKNATNLKKMGASVQILKLPGVRHQLGQDLVGATAGMLDA